MTKNKNVNNLFEDVIKNFFNLCVFLCALPLLPILIPVAVYTLIRRYSATK